MDKQESAADTGRRYHQDGYVIRRGVLTKTEARGARDTLDEMIQSMDRTRKVYRDGREIEVEMRPEFLTEPHPKHPFWMGLCRHPRVLDAVEAVLGPNLILIMSHLIVKRPEDGLAVEWHQDNTYWHSVEGTDVCTVWLAVDDTDLENGCMKVIPRTQQGRQELNKVKTDGDDLHPEVAPKRSASQSVRVAHDPRDQEGQEQRRESQPVIERDQARQSGEHAREHEMAASPGLPVAQ